MGTLNPEAIDAVHRLSQRGYADFPEATQAVLEMLERQLPASAVFVGHLDHADRRFAIIDSRGDAGFGLEAGAGCDLDESFCIHMATGRAPRRCNDAGADQVYGGLSAQREMNIASYVGVPLELADGSAVGSLCAISHEKDRYSETDLQLLHVVGRLLSYELERERRERDLVQLTELLRKQAGTDSLTSLPNRRAFMDGAAREWQLSRRDGIPGYVVVLDLNGFKAVNDSAGHAMGDAALRLFADVLRRTARETDLVGRLGGDEFGAVLVRSLSVDAPDAFIRRLRDRLADAVAEHPIEIGVAAGWAPLADAPSLEQALEDADRRMYTDKASSQTKTRDKSSDTSASANDRT